MAKTKTLTELHKLERQMYLGKSDKVPSTSKSIEELQKEHLENQAKQDAKIEKRGKEYQEKQNAKGEKAEVQSTVVTAGVITDVSLPESIAETTDVQTKLPHTPNVDNTENSADKQQIKELKNETKDTKPKV